jgi:hypothetical protein
MTEVTVIKETDAGGGRYVARFDGIDDEGRSHSPIALPAS